MPDHRPSSKPAPRVDAIQRVRDSFSRQGLVGTLGAWLVELELGRATIEIPFSNRVAGQSGRFHAAVVAGISQACGGTAAATLAAEGGDLAPHSIDLAYHGGTDGELLRAIGRATATSLSRWTVEVEVMCRRDGADTKCATANLVFELLPASG